MLRLFSKFLLASFFALSIFSVEAQKVNEPSPTPAEWSRPFQPFRIAGNLYYVGTYDLACYLITSKKGHILINTGLASSAEQIKKNIKALGFKFTDIKILLTTQAHYDHLGAMAAIKKETGAKMMVDEADADVMENGGSNDYALGGEGYMYAPIKADSLLQDGDSIKMGENLLVMLHHPGHTKGSCSFMVTTKDKKKSYRVLIANMPTIVTEHAFDAIPAYPGISKDYAYTLKAMRQLKFDLWVASHASQFGLHSKRLPGDAYNPSAFKDRKGYNKLLEELQQDYDEHLKK